MIVRRRILFYSDAPEYGGHEAMTLKAATYLSSRNECDVAFAHYQGNSRLSQKLAEHTGQSSSLTPLQIPFRSRTLQSLRSFVCRGELRRIQSLMADVNPETVIVSQGRVESGSAAVLAAKRLGVRTVSYIPMAHPVSVSGRPMATGARDALNRYFYRLPDKFVTISTGVRAMLRARGATSQIAVVPNGIEPITIRSCDRQEFRADHGIEPNQFAVAVVGRIEFRQKRQDFALRCFARLAEKGKNWKLLFVGSGPDERTLRAMICDMKLADFAEVLPWSANPANIYAGIDALLIPSRFEGVPLVMLEAMSCGLPIAASDVDGMAESLPKGWLFPPGDADALIDTLAAIRQQDLTALLDANREKVAAENSFAEFGPRFARAALG